MADGPIVVLHSLNISKTYYGHFSITVSNLQSNESYYHQATPHAGGTSHPAPKDNRDPNLKTTPTQPDNGVTNNSLASQID